MEGCVLDAVAVYFSDVEVGLNGFYVRGGDAVGGAVDDGWVFFRGLLGLAEVLVKGCWQAKGAWIGKGWILPLHPDYSKTIALST